MSSDGRVVGTCRICFDDVGPQDDGVEPCECKDGGKLLIAHRGCIQEWIRLRPSIQQGSQHKDANSCEVCNTTWKQTYEIPAQAVRQEAMTREERDELAQRLLISAWARSQNIGGLRPRGADAIILRELGPHYEGPWRSRSRRSRSCIIA